MGKSSGPKRLPTGSAAEVKPGQYDQKPAGAPEHPQTTEYLPLPMGPSGTDYDGVGGIPEGVLGPNSRHANQHQAPKRLPDPPSSTTRLPLPTGESRGGKPPKGVVNPRSKHADEGSRKGTKR